MQSSPTWPLLPSTGEPCPVGQAPTPPVLSAEEWIARCATRLRELVQDEGVDGASLVRLAAALAEERPYRDMGPEAAAERQQLDEA